MKILVYCNDVSGVFDRVCRSRLMQELKGQGFHLKLVKLISYWLEPKDAHVVINGAQSASFQSLNLVFQRTVLETRL